MKFYILHEIKTSPKFNIRDLYIELLYLINLLRNYDFQRKFMILIIMTSFHRKLFASLSLSFSLCIFLTYTHT